MQSPARFVLLAACLATSALESSTASGGGLSRRSSLSGGGLSRRSTTCGRLADSPSHESAASPSSAAGLDCPAGSRAGTPLPPGSPWSELPITIILLDDVGWNLIQNVHTPCIDALAAGGVTFTRAWAYPSCSPARAALLTGRHAWRTGVGSVLKWSWSGTNPGLKASEVTLAELLPEPVEAFGKWHLSYRKDDPNLQGFDHYAGSFFKQEPSYYRFLKTVDGVSIPGTIYGTTDTTNDARASTALVRYVAYHAVHDPIENPPGGTAKGDLGKVYEMLGYLDREIGRLLEGYSGYVFLISDNGSNWQFGGAKGSLKEGGIRVPFIVNGPGITPRVSTDLVSIVDIYATLAEMRGVPCAAEDSVSLMPILQGQPGRRKTVYAEKFFPNHTLDNREQAIRNDGYKLVESSSGTKLYSMPGEQLIPPPWSQREKRAARFLRSRLP